MVCFHHVTMVVSSTEEWYLTDVCILLHHYSLQSILTPLFTLSQYFVDQVVYHSSYRQYFNGPLHNCLHLKEVQIDSFLWSDSILLLP